MRTVVFITSGAEYSGRNSRLSLLARHLPRERWRPIVVSLGTPSHSLAALKEICTTIPWQRRLDPRPLQVLRDKLRGVAADAIHVWGRPALYAALASGLPPSRLLVSGVLPATHAPHFLTCQLLRRVGRVVAFGKVETSRYRALGVASQRLVEVPLAVEATDEQHRLPAREMLCVGPLLAHKGFREAVWAFDILRFLYSDLRLVLAGDGPDRPRIEHFARVTNTRDSVDFLGYVTDLAARRQRATLAWLPGRAGGVQVALETQAAGLPLIAFRTPQLAEVIQHNVTGVFVPPGEPAELAKQTRLLLDDPARQAALAQAARARVQSHYSVGAMIDACASVYET